MNSVQTIQKQQQNVEEGDRGENGGDDVSCDNGRSRGRTGGENNGEFRM